MFLQSLRVWARITCYIGCRVPGFRFRVDRQAQSRELVRVLAVPACLEYSHVFLMYGLQSRICMYVSITVTLFLCMDYSEVAACMDYSHVLGYRVSGFGSQVDRQAQSRELVRVLAVPACMGQSYVFGYRVPDIGFRVVG